MQINQSPPGTYLVILGPRIASAPPHHTWALFAKHANRPCAERQQQRARIPGTVVDARDNRRFAQGWVNHFLPFFYRSLVFMFATGRAGCVCCLLKGRCVAWFAGSRRRGGWPLHILAESLFDVSALLFHERAEAFIDPYDLLDGAAVEGEVVRPAGTVSARHETRRVAEDESPAEAIGASGLRHEFHELTRVLTTDEHR